MLADRRFAVLAFALLVVFWSSAFGVIKISLEYASPVLFAGTRTLLCGVVMALVALVWGGRPNFGRDWPVYVLLAAFNVVLFIGAQSFTVLYLASGTAAVVIYLQPILVGLLAFLFLGEPLSTAKVTGLLLGFAGVVVVSAGSMSGEALGTPLGIAFGVGSAVSWALGTVYFKRYGERLSMLWAVAAPFTIGGVVLTAVGLVLEPFSEISWNAIFVAGWLYTSLVGTALAWVLWLGLVRAGEASRVSAYVFIVPVVSVLLGALFLEETLSPLLLVGAALVVSGIYLVNKQSTASDQPAAKNKNSEAGC